MPVPEKRLRPHERGVSRASGWDPTAAAAAFDACFRAYYTEVLAYALRRVGERPRAEDVAAETFAVAWRRLDDLPSEPLPWLLGIARGVMLNDARTTRRRSRLRARMAGARTSGSGPDPADAVAERSAILAALGRLSEREREVLRLAAWEGLDGRAAAAALGCSRGAYAVRLHRARRQLAKELAAPGIVGGERELALPAPAGEESG